MTAASAPTSRLATLETLRGMASVAVVFHHIAQQRQGTALASHAAGPLLLWLGGWGVTVFFVLSGFCIHGSVLKTEHGGRLEPDWQHYFIRRARRILPGYLFAIALSIALGCLGDSNLITRARWADLWAHLTFTSGFSQDTALRINSVLWTVVVEVHFYLAYPLFIWCRNRMGIVRLTAMLVVLSFCIKLGGRLWLEDAGRWTWHHSFLNLWWIWSLGALLAERHASWLTRQTGSPALNHPMMAVTALVFSLAFGCLDGKGNPMLAQVMETYGLPLLAAVVVAAFVRSPLAVLRARTATGLGEVSYSMYLLHPVALWLVVQGLPAAPPVIAVSVMLALAWLLAQAGYRIIERPFLKT
ncbi:MAG: rane protein of unknown function [Verrucomicrobiaceae bacterium]|nr:rane protein of unknown function [Verrucomicrobiaceae bacterium]